jgi:hypothetical protein
MKNCRSCHEKCQSFVLPSPRRLPTRLIDLGTGPTIRPRLCESAGLPLETQYMTLSHCWGQMKFLTMKSTNINAFKTRGIPVSLLTKTFKEAMEATRRLNVRYIWIDSLCIIQDSVGDWRHEAPLMGDVYQHTYLNIAASGAVNGADGLFRARNPLGVTPLKIEALWDHQNPAIFHLTSSTDWDTLRSWSLYTRGWVVQELILAPRILYFGRTQLFWQCSSECRSEIQPFQANKQAGKIGLDRQIVAEEISRRCQQIIEVEFGLWTRIVDRYSSCLLTYQSDKLMAISGIARLLGSGDNYLAGLWRENIQLCLPWRASPRAGETPRSSEDKMPSWSWASVNCGVSLDQPWAWIPAKNSSAVKVSYMVEVISACVFPLADDPFGQVTGGELCLRGPLLKTSFKSLADHSDSGRCHLGEALCAVYPDGPQYDEDETLFCMPSYFTGNRPWGIVLQRTERQGQYQRRGSFRLLYADRSNNGDHRNEERFLELCKNSPLALSDGDYESKADVNILGLPEYTIKII